MKKYKIKTSFGAYPIICFKGSKIAYSYNKDQFLLRKNGKIHFFYKISIYKTIKKNILWHIEIFSSNKEEDGHSFAGYSKRKREILIELQNFNVLFGIKLPDINNPEYNKIREYKLQSLRNIYNKTRSDCISKIKSFDFVLK